MKRSSSAMKSMILTKNSKCFKENKVKIGSKSPSRVTKYKAQPSGRKRRNELQK